MSFILTHAPYSFAILLIPIFAVLMTLHPITFLMVYLAIACALGFAPYVQDLATHLRRPKMVEAKKPHLRLVHSK